MRLVVRQASRWLRRIDAECGEYGNRAASLVKLVFEEAGLR